MPVDYSKWDNLELSDDSDIEVHPNVDKRSFIRAKQAQIHQDRAHRRHQIATLKYERIINDGLLSRIDRLLAALKSHKSKTDTIATEVVLQALMESAGDPAEDQPPPAPEGVHTGQEAQPAYSKMMAVLVDQVKQDVDKAKPENRLDAFIKGIESHHAKVEDLQTQLLAKLGELEKEDKRHITSDDIHTGFDVSHVPKTQSEAPASSKKVAVELLNPESAGSDNDQSSGADADIEDGNNPGEDESIKPSKLGYQFAKIHYGDYAASWQFISKNPSVLSERDTDGLLVEAFNNQMEGNDKYARQCVHQALLIQYCRQLGKDGVALFFKRVMTKNHQAQKLFLDDVNSTYHKIRTRATELNKEQADNASKGGVEQIQLHAVDPNTTINIRVPPPIRTGAEIDPTEPPQSKEEIAARQVFESFPPGLQRALESGSLDDVNVVLGKMSVEEAEEIVGKLGDGGMLSLEEGVLDATTEEGQRIVDEISRTGQMPQRWSEGLSEDPPMD